MRGPYRSGDDLAQCVPRLNRKELTLLARIGALNWVEGVAHRRDALQQVEWAGRPKGPLLRQECSLLHEAGRCLPLVQMTVEERLVADYTGTGLTVGQDPMYYRRAELRRWAFCRRRICVIVATECSYAWPGA